MRGARGLHINFLFDESTCFVFRISFVTELALWDWYSSCLALWTCRESVCNVATRLSHANTLVSISKPSVTAMLNIKDSVRATVVHEVLTISVERTGLAERHACMQHDIKSPWKPSS